MELRVVSIVSACILAGCAHSAADEADLAPAASESAAPASEPAPIRGQLNGRAFPDGVLALTWDDGPDRGTLALAEYLRRERVSATFFVIEGWQKGVSSDPGFGAHVYDTGYGKLPLLGDLVALGHRIGNHTMHHALLGHATPDAAARELRDAQRLIDPYLRDEVRFFRAPGGDWSSGASRAVDADPYLANLVGPIRWDVDAKDWEGSVWCESSPAHECEHEDGRYRVRADVMAQRYEKAIASSGRGIVLLHDRVGDVGSSYALDVAQRLVPWLVSRGYVFAAPVLAFGPNTTRWTPGACGELRLGDVDGDGRADACARQGDKVLCAMATFRHEDGLERASFDDAARASATLPAHAARFDVVDVSGDGRADLCARIPGGVACALARASGGFGPFEIWSEPGDFAEASFDGTIRFADVDGDGLADVCGRSPAGVVCARSTGEAFERARPWLPDMSDQSAFRASDLASSMALGDVDGDGRADLCVRGRAGVFCALSKRTAFGRLSRWSAETFSGALALGDLNGDGRADVCAGASCALSNGHALVKSVAWLDADPRLAAQWAGLEDINGDGRTDTCSCDGDGVRCALAP